MGGLVSGLLLSSQVFVSELDILDELSVYVQPHGTQFSQIIIVCYEGLMIAPADELFPH